MRVSADEFHEVYFHDATSFPVTLHFSSTLSPIKTTELLGIVTYDFTAPMLDKTTET